ncbi:MAG: bifunctional hydroxymethylpyrimidine kinase/phosphomethylpyrimidine kinase [Candidatus Methanodesulfokora sp.]|jgi:hydroxymethylpyrimidine/phosphomethylpyrimidine kinase|nr:MAG: bifunctional hydroxymethylpyrimidine kinase/phosphomethylpyrimidine kinase [Candidatus Korarchaeota archaeon]
MIPVALTIAGSDSGGGAGIQADLKTFAALGVHGTCAITAITAQNTFSVIAVQEIEPDVVEKQIDAIVQDMGVDAAKTGMLSSSRIIEAVSRAVRRYGFPLVVDPVMIAKSGAPLLREDAVEALKKEIIPLAKVVTPNIPEAEKLSGMRISSLDDMKKAAKEIVEELGAEAVVVKGGHAEGEESVDILYHSGNFREFRMRRIKSKNTHGTGCSFSAAIAAELAKGNGIEEAVKRAKEFIYMAIDYGFSLGKGNGPVNPIAPLQLDAEKFRVLENIKEAIKILEENGALVSNLIPECQMNLVMGLPKHYLRGIEDVAGIPGRIVRIGTRIKASSCPEFGASWHMARALIKASDYDPRVRAAVNIKYSDEILRALERLGIESSYYDRREEPDEVRRKEGASIPWGIEQAVRRAGKLTEAIIDLGGIGKEPMVKIFGPSAVDVARRLVEIGRCL